MWQYARRFAVSGLLPIGVTGVGHDMEVADTEYLLRCFSHRLQAAIICWIQHYGIRHDQRMFRIDCGLHIVGR